MGKGARRIKEAESSAYKSRKHRAGRSHGDCCSPLVISNTAFISCFIFIIFVFFHVCCRRRWLSIVVFIVLVAAANDSVFSDAF